MLFFHFLSNKQRFTMANILSPSTPVQSTDSTRTNSDDLPTSGVLGEIFVGSDSSYIASSSNGARESFAEPSSGMSSGSKRPRIEYTDYKATSYRPSTHFIDGAFTAFRSDFIQGLPDRLGDIPMGKELRPVRLPGEPEDWFQEAERRFNDRNGQLFYCLTNTLQLNGKQSLLNQCPYGDGLAAWNYLSSVSTSTNTVARAALVRDMKNFRQAEDDTNDMGHRIALEAMFTEASRSGLLNAHAIEALAPLFYLESLPESLHRIKEIILLSGMSVKLTTSGIYESIVSHRKFNERSSSVEAHLAKPSSNKPSPSKSPRKAFGSRRKIPSVTAEERAGTCSICSKPGHGPRTCFKNPMNKTAVGNVAVEVVDTDNEALLVDDCAPAISLLAIVTDDGPEVIASIDTPQATQLGKEFSSNNKGDGPTPAEECYNFARENVVRIISNFLWPEREERFRNPHQFIITDLVEILHVLGFKDPVREMFILFCTHRDRQVHSEFVESIPAGLDSEGFDGTFQSLWDFHYAINPTILHSYLNKVDPFNRELQIMIRSLDQHYGLQGTMAHITEMELVPRKRAHLKLAENILATVDSASYIAEMAETLVPLIGNRECYEQELRLLRDAEEVIRHVRHRLLFTTAGVFVSSGRCPDSVLGQSDSELAPARQSLKRPRTSFESRYLNQFDDQDPRPSSVPDSSWSRQGILDYMIAQRRDPRELPMFRDPTESSTSSAPTSDPSESSASSASVSDHVLQESLIDLVATPPEPVTVHVDLTLPVIADVDTPQADQLGKEFSSNNKGDGPTGFSKPVRKARLGQRPKLVKFVVDSGCSRHMVNSNTVPLTETSSSSARISGIDKDHPMMATEVGKFGVLSNVLGVADLSHNLVSVGAACVNGYKFLFSKNGVTMFDDSDEFFSSPLIEGKLINNLFYFDLSTEPIQRNDYTLPEHIAMPATIIPENRAALWHARFGHISTHTIKLLIEKSMTLDFKQAPSKTMWNDYAGVRCEACVKGKLTLAPVKTTSAIVDSHTVIDKVHDNKYSKGQLVCMDLLTSSIPSIGQSRYALVLMDAGTRYLWTYFLKTKTGDEVGDAIHQWIRTLRVDGVKAEAFMTIRSDNGKEFIAAQNVTLLAENGIRHERSPPNHHVYLIERVNRTIQEMARCMLMHADLSPRFWAEAVAAATYTLNRLPCKPYNMEQTRYEAYFGVKPDVSNLRTFGCHCWVRSYDGSLKIWSNRAERYRFIGYNLDSPLTWKVSNIATEVPLHSSNVIFDEGERHLGAGLSYDTDIDFLFQDNPELESSVDGPVDQVFVTPEDPNTTKRKNRDIDYSEIVAKRPHLAPRSTRSTSRGTQQRSSIQGERLTCPVPDDTLSEVEPSVLDHVQEVVESLVAQYTDSSTEEPQTPAEKLYQFQQRREAMVEAFALVALERKVQFAYDIPTPLSERQARASPHSAQWIQGMLEEMQSLGDNDTFELVEKPPGIMVLGHKWVYKIKTNEAGEITRFKCRYTALGNRQREYIDYDETFAPVVRSSSLKTLLAIAAARDLIVHQMDVDTAFLYGVMPPEPTLYMEVPEGYPIPFHLVGKTNLVGIVKKGIYGLKQSPKLWNDTVNAYMISLGFTRFTTDLCIYKRKSEADCLFVAIYVDDLIIAGSSLPSINIFKEELKSKFKMKDLGPIHYCLGMEVRQDLEEGTITLSQNGYVDSILRRFGLLLANPTPIPMSSTLDLTLDGTETNFEDISTFDYPSAIGSLLYLSGCTRPDITFAVNRLSRSLNAHRAAHHRAAIHVMRYLKGCPGIGLIYRRKKSIKLVGFSDADWAAETNGRRSVTGYLFSLGDSPISWNSKMQTTVANSSTEAEYLAMGASTKEAIYLERLLTELDVRLEAHFITTKDLQDSHGAKLKIFGDNQGALTMTSSTKLNHKATKWYLVREHFIRDLVQSGALIVQYCDTENMPADMLTKALALLLLRRHRDFTMTSAR